MAAVDEVLDVFGQQPGLKIYTQICLCFAVCDESAHPKIVETLSQGLERLSSSFPWTAGQVAVEPSLVGRTGISKIKPLERVPRLRVVDLRNEAAAPTMDGLRRDGFPMTVLDENGIAPRTTLPSPAADPSDPEPVFLLQATFIVGGLLLAILSHHGAMDMTGQSELMRLLSKACQGKDFTSEEKAAGNVDRRNIIPLLDESYQPGGELDHQMAKAPPAHLVPPPAVSSSWANFSFDAGALQGLKDLAAKTKAPSVGFVSTDDALSAFIWQCTARARLPRLEAGSETTLARAVDPRPFLGLPKTYPGLVQNMTYHRFPARELAAAPLGAIASDLRAGVDPETSTLAFQTRALATAMHRAADKSAFNVTAGLDPGRDVMLSSWAQVRAYDLDFGLGLGRPEAVRRPRFAPVESLMYLLPRRPDGEISAAICLRDEDMERLKSDREFATYAKYIG